MMSEKHTRPLSNGVFWIFPKPLMKALFLLKASVKALLKVCSLQLQCCIPVEVQATASVI